jgi:hypothetical protein
MNQTIDRSITMDALSEDLARAQLSAYRQQAHEHGLATNLARARRLSRKAERAAAQARLALARVI